MTKEVYENNRKKVFEKIKDNSIVIMFAGEALKKTADELYPFTPNRNFYYLTGVSEENHILFMSKINGEETCKMYIKDIDLELEKWIGKSLREDEALEISGVDEVKFKSSFESDLHKIIQTSEEINVYLDLERDKPTSNDSASNKYAKILRDRYANVGIKNIYNIIAALRLVKSKEEVDNMREAIKITTSGVELMMKNSKPGMKEYELEAYFDFTCKSNGVKDLAFNTIAAAGKNATVLHYVENNSNMKDNDLILFDLGAQYNYYSADISRTFPVNGKFTERQKEVYNAVLRVNEAVINMIKPGVKYVDVNKKATDLIAEECIKLGIIKDKKDVRNYYWHSIGHSLGLDTHDVEVPQRNITFEPGVVFTVEPGIYISEEGIGIRIEDDVLVTENGVEVLTKDMIKTVDEIEEFMSKNN